VIIKNLKANNYFPIQHELTGFLTGAYRVYCAVGAESSSKIQVNIRL